MPHGNDLSSVTDRETTVAPTDSSYSNSMSTEDRLAPVPVGYLRDYEDVGCSTPERGGVEHNADCRST